MSAAERVQPVDLAPPPELSRPLPIARIGAGLRFLVDAGPDECAALAARMGLPGIDALTCQFDLRRRQGDTIEAIGVLRARVRQTCVLSLDPFDALVAEDFRVCFVPDGRQSEDLDLQADDELTYTGDMLDLGEAASEQLALALDPFPRKPDAAAPVAASAPSVGAFAALAKLLPPQ